MAVPVVASSTTNSAGATATLTMTKPSGVTTGDLLIVLCGSESGTTNGYTTPPAGWTLINYANQSTATSVAAFFRVADGSEPSTTDFTQGASSDSWGVYLRITGADGADPIDVVGGDYASPAQSSHSITGVTTTIADCLAFVVGVSPNTGALSYSPSGGWSTTNVDSGGGSACSGFWATKTQASAGATGSAGLDFGEDSLVIAAFQFAVSSTVDTTNSRVGIRKSRGALPLSEMSGRTHRARSFAEDFVPPPTNPQVGIRVSRGAAPLSEFRGRARRARSFAEDFTPTPPVPRGPARRVLRTAFAPPMFSGRVVRHAPATAPATIERELALLVDLDIHARTAYRVIARNLDTGVETVLGEALPDALTLEDVALADGRYVLRVEVDGTWWRGARYAREWPVTIVDWEIEAPLPPVVNLKAHVVGSALYVSWAVELGDYAVPEDFAVWVGSSLPVSTASAPAATAAFAGWGGYMVEIAAELSTSFVGVGARSAEGVGPVSVSVSKMAIPIASPLYMTSRNRDGRWASNEQTNA